MKAKTAAKANCFLAYLLLSFSCSTIALGLTCLMLPGNIATPKAKQHAKAWMVYSCFGIGISIPWKTKAKSVQAEIDEDEKTATPCRQCQYYSQELQARQYLQHPCSVHPSGKPDHECRDWEPRS